MEYKWNILINQRAALELGLNLDLIDLAIFDYIKGFVLSNKCTKVNTEEGTFYWVSHKNIKDSMPLLNIKSDQGIVNRIKKLIDAGLLFKYARCDEFGKTLYSFGPNYDSFEFFDTPQQNLGVPQTKLGTNNILDNNNPLSNNNTTCHYIDIPHGGKESIDNVPGEEITFERFRKAYKGTKRGLKTEFDNFKKKTKDWREVLPTLLPAYERQQAIKQEAVSKGCFVPQEKNLQTYLNQRCWEEEPQFTPRTNGNARNIGRVMSMDEIAQVVDAGMALAKM